MKILHVTSSLAIGGAETMLSNLALRQQKAGYQVVVVTLFEKGQLSKKLETEKISVINLDLRLSLPSLYKCINSLAKLIKTLQPEVVQSWMYYSDLMAFMALKLSGRRRSTKIIWGVRCSNMDMSNYRLLLKLTMKLCSKLSKYTDVIAVNSKAGAIVHQKSGYAANKMQIVHNGVDVDKFKPIADKSLRQQLGLGQDEIVFGIFARDDPMKGYDVLFRALKSVVNQDFKLLIAGTGTEKFNRQEKVIALGCRSDMPDLMNSVDAIISMSKYGEGFSNSIAEAMACAKSAIGTDVGDTKLIIAQTGLIIAPDNSQALASAINQYVTNGKQWMANMGEKARQRIVSQYSINRSVNRFAQLYKKTNKAETNVI